MCCFCFCFCIWRLAIKHWKAYHWKKNMVFFHFVDTVVRVYVLVHLIEFFPKNRTDWKTATKEYDLRPISAWVAENRDSTGWIRSVWHSDFAWYKVGNEKTTILGVHLVVTVVEFRKLRCFFGFLLRWLQASQQRVANGPFPHEKVPQRRRPWLNNTSLITFPTKIMEVKIGGFFQ